MQVSSIQIKNALLSKRFKQNTYFLDVNWKQEAQRLVFAPELAQTFTFTWPF